MQAHQCLIESHYLPSAAFLSIFKKYESVIIDGHENYQKGSYRNRAYILGPNGPQRLSVPLRKGKHEQQPIREVQISYDEPWHRQQWKSIMTAYGNAPYFEYYKSELKSLIISKHETLFELNMKALIWLCNKMGLPEQQTEISTNFYDKVPPGIADLRNTIRPGEDVELDWFRQLQYPQVFESRFGFVPQLSGLDLLFCLGPASGIYLEQCILPS